MKLKTLLLTALLPLALLATTTEVKIEDLPSYSTHFDKEANPYKYLEIALKKATREKKKVLLLVGGDWCKWCGELDNFLDDHEEIAKDFYNSFEVVRVYYGKGVNKEGQSLLKQFPVLKGTPHFYVLNNKAKLLKSFATTPLERGFGYNKHKIKAFIKEYR